MNTTTTPEQEKKLQLALVKMLPEKLIIDKWIIEQDNCDTESFDIVLWQDKETGQTAEILDTEWLHICWLIEQALTDNVLLVYESLLRGIVINDEDNTNRSEYTASWQQRALALCRVKGVEV